MKRIHLFVAVVWMAAFAVLPLVPWPTLQALDEGHWIKFLELLAFGLLAESLTVRFSLGKGGGGQSSISFVPLLACIVLFGPAPTVLFMLVVGTAGEVLLRKKEFIKAGFNIAQWTFAVSLSGLLFAGLGGVPLQLLDVAALDQVNLTRQVIAFLAFATVLLGLNAIAVSLAIALSQQTKFSNIASKVLGQSGINVLFDLLVSPIALALAYLYLKAGMLGLGMFLLPMLAIRHAYQINHRLQQANRDLLKALVKAIETRDPYTSGHSLRVSSLALRICDAVGISGRKAEMIETAALLHDIGKIDAIYTEILSKPDQLSPAERTIIESHVVKGVDLLQSVSSFPREVLESVRYHHERIDGRGYPDGLRGDDIPIGAKIIKVCDAIDAMLSDRPYRKALPIPTVREELRVHSGTQFDAKLVEGILTSNLLEDHAAELDVYRQVNKGTRDRVETGAATPPPRTAGSAA